MRLFNFRSFKQFIFLFLILTTGFSYGQQKNAADKYQIRIDKDSPKKAFVEVELVVRDSLLYMSGIGANQFPSRWAHFVHDIKAESPDGNEIKIDSLQGAQWRVFSPDGSKINLSYTIHLNHEDYKWEGGVDGAAYVTDWGVFYTGRSIFIMSGTTKEHLEIHFRIPKNWKVSTPWDRLNDSYLSYSTTNQTTLSNGMVFAGTHEEQVIKRDDFELIFAFGGEEIIKQKQSFIDMASGVMDYYIDLMGGVPNPSPDNKFKKSILVMNSSAQTDGEVIGNNISILLEKNGDQMSQLLARFIFAHEFFHLWNGKSFVPENEECEWFKEGVSNYYTLKSLFHIGFLNEQSYLMVMDNFFYQRYHNDKGVGKLSLTRGDQKHDHWGLIYSGGFFAGISQDMIIRTSTRNEQSLDDIMRTLFRKYGGTNNRYTLSELESLMSDSSGKDQQSFFNTYVKGSVRIPLDHFLNMGGFSAVEDNGKIQISTKENRNFMETEISNGFFGKN